MRERVAFLELMTLTLESTQVKIHKKVNEAVERNETRALIVVSSLRAL